MISFIVPGAAVYENKRKSYAYIVLYLPPEYEQIEWVGIRMSYLLINKYYIQSLVSEYPSYLDLDKNDWGVIFFSCTPGRGSSRSVSTSFAWMAYVSRSIFPVYRYILKMKNSRY